MEHDERERIKVRAAIIQKAVEWKAKLDIADVKANAKIVKAAFKSIDKTIKATGELISKMMGARDGV